MIPELAMGVTTDDFSMRTLESKYDLHQAELINAGVTSIVRIADEEYVGESVSDGPSGQGPK
jgi:hypothetical protein